VSLDTEPAAAANAAALRVVRVIPPEPITSSKPRSIEMTPSINEASSGESLSDKYELDPKSHRLNTYTKNAITSEAEISNTTLRRDVWFMTVYS
jgi:hypothetical protein